MQTVFNISSIVNIVCAIAFLIVSFWEKRFLFIVVMLLSAVNTDLNRPAILPTGEKEIIFSGVVVGEDHREDYVKLLIHVDKALFKKDTIDYDITVDFYTFQDEVFLGKRLLIRGKIRPAKSINRPNILTGSIIGIYSSRNIFEKIIHSMRSHIDHLLHKLFYDSQYEIASGLILGGSGRLKRDLKEVFSRAGILHILAVSGLHIGFVIMFVSISLFFIPLPYKIKFIIILVVLFFYAAITGFRPSVCRASLMALLFGLSIILQRNVDRIHIINIVAIIFLIANPLLLFDVGAQLSFAAVYGILFLYPKIEENVISKAKSHWVKYILTLMAVSFAAQMFVSPLLIYYFHRLPTLAVITNVIIVPIASIIIFLLYLCLMLGSFLISVAKIIAIPVSLLIVILVAVSRFFATLPFSTIRLIVSPILLLLLYFMFPSRTRKIAIWMMLSFIMFISLASFSDCIVIRIAPSGVLITTPAGEDIFIKSKYSATEDIFLYQQGIEKIDYLIAPVKNYSVAKEFVESPENLYFKNIEYGEMNIKMSKDIEIKFRSQNVVLRDRDFYGLTKENKIIYLISNGRDMYQYNTVLFNSIIDQIIIDARLIFAKLIFLF